MEISASNITKELLQQQKLYFNLSKMLTTLFLYKYNVTIPKQMFLRMALDEYVNIYLNENVPWRYRIKSPAIANLNAIELHKVNKILINYAKNPKLVTIRLANQAFIRRRVLDTSYKEAIIKLNKKIIT